jgi:hypothetical protein
MKTKEDLILFCNQWDEAMVRNNVEEIASFMSDDWVIVGTEGGITSKLSFLEFIKSGDLTHNRMDSDETTVRIYENTGIVISRGTSAGNYKDQSFSLYEWSTSVFIYKDEKWSCILTMLTPAHIEKPH